VYGPGCPKRPGSLFHLFAVKVYHPPRTPKTRPGLAGLSGKTAAHHPAIYGENCGCVTAAMVISPSHSLPYHGVTRFALRAVQAPAPPGGLGRSLSLGWEVWYGNRVGSGAT
jgi:hypothetical protein